MTSCSELDDARELRRRFPVPDNLLRPYYVASRRLPVPEIVHPEAVPGRRTENAQNDFPCGSRSSRTPSATRLFKVVLARIRAFYRNSACLFVVISHHYDFLTA